MTDTLTSSYTQYGNREDLSDLITNISPDATHFLSNIREEDADSTKLEWLTDEDADPDETNAQVEGHEPDAAASGTRTRLYNYTQVQDKAKSISSTQEWVKKAGIESEIDYQTTKMLREIAKDAEIALLANTAYSAGASAVGRKTKGAVGFIATNTATGESAKWSAVDGTSGNGEQIFNDLLQTIWQAGGEPEVVYMDGTRKRGTASWTGGNTNNRNQEDKRIVNGLTFYETDFGIVRLKAHWVFAKSTNLTGKVLIVETKRYAVAWGERTNAETLAKTGKRTKRMVSHEMGLKAYQELSSGKITLS